MINNVPMYIIFCIAYVFCVYWFNRKSRWRFFSCSLGVVMLMVLTGLKYFYLMRQHWSQEHILHFLSREFYLFLFLSFLPLLLSTVIGPEKNALQGRRRREWIVRGLALILLAFVWEEL